MTETERIVLGRADNDVVDEVDPEDLRGLPQLACQSAVLGTRRRVAAGVVCETTIATADARIAILNTSRGCASAHLSIPSVTIARLIGLFFRSRQTTHRLS